VNVDGEVTLRVIDSMWPKIRSCLGYHLDYNGLVAVVGRR